MKHNQDHFNLLRKIELFSSLADDEIQGIVCNDSLLAFGPGEMVVRSVDSRNPGSDDESKKQP